MRRLPVGRARHRPGGLRRGDAQPAARRHRAQPRRLRARARPARRRARDARARHLPRRAGAQRRARRLAAPARRRLHRRLDRAPPGGARPHHDALGADRSRLAARARDGRDRGRGQLVPPPVRRPPRPGAARGGVGAGRGRRGPRERRAPSSTWACSGTWSRSSTAPSTSRCSASWSRRPTRTGPRSGGCARHERALVGLEHGGRRGAVDGRHRGGGDAARAERVEPHLALRGGARGAARLHDRAHGRRDPRLRARARDPAARRHRRRDRRAARAAQRAREGDRAARDPRRGRRHAPVHAVGGRRGLPRRALPVPLLLDARARPARADVRPARPRRGAEPGAGRARLQPRARAPADPARAVGQLAVLAGPRHRAVLDAHAALPGLPARRDPAPVPLLRRLRRGRRRAAALRRVPRADVPVVGRAAAAALRHARDPRHGRADARRRHRGDRRARAVPRAAGGARGPRRPRARHAAPRCSTRTASSPRATAWPRS